MTIGRGTFKETIPHNGPLPTYNQTFGNAEARAYLYSLIENGVVEPNKNSYFPIHSGSDLFFPDKGACAFHSVMDIRKLNKGVDRVAYALIPDKCQRTVFLSTVHELFEAVVFGWQKIEGPNIGANEIADLCAYQTGSIIGGDGRNYTVQREWSNLDGGCVLTVGGDVTPANPPDKYQPSASTTISIYSKTTSSSQYTRSQTTSSVVASPSVSDFTSSLTSSSFVAPASSSTSSYGAASSTVSSNSFSSSFSVSQSSSSSDATTSATATSDSLLSSSSVSPVSSSPSSSSSVAAPSTVSSDSLPSSSSMSTAFSYTFSTTSFTASSNLLSSASTPISSTKTNLIYSSATRLFDSSIILAASFVGGLVVLFF